MQLNEILSLCAVTGTTFLVLLFLRAMFHKLADVERFSGFLLNYQLLPQTWVQQAVHLIIGLEGLIILMLMMPALNRAGAFLASSLLLIYALAMLLNLLRGRVQISCGCGGPAMHLSYGLVLRNGLMVMMAVPSILRPNPQLALLDAGVAVMCGAILCLLYSVAEQLMANFNHARLLANASSIQ